MKIQELPRESMRKLSAAERIKRLEEVETERRKELEETQKRVEEDIEEAEQLIETTKQEIAEEEQGWQKAARRKTEDDLEEIVETEAPPQEEIEAASLYDAGKGAYGSTEQDTYAPRTEEQPRPGEPTSMDDVYRDTGPTDGYKRSESGYKSDTEKIGEGTSASIRKGYRGL